MAPVVRISDEVFERLQNLGKPFVDTPSTVIERLLDLYETRAGNAAASTATMPGPATSQEVPTADRDWALFLAPATRENIAVSLSADVSLDVARRSLPDAEYKKLEAAMGPERGLRCWAMTETRRAVFAAMDPGDYVLFMEKGSGKFTHIGRVLTKFVSEAFGARIWPVTSGLPWKLVYVLRDVQIIDVPRGRLVNQLGYHPDFLVPGHMKVSSANLKQALQRHGTLERLLEYARAR